MLSEKNRKKYLEYLGYKDSKSGYLKLQKKYFKRKSDQDGVYGKATDTLLYNAYWIRKNAPHFDLTEFRCPSSCTGFPVRINKNLLVALEMIRKYYGKPITITCGERCKKYNASLKGSVSNSLHLKGSACDIYIKGITDTKAGRKALIKWAKKNIPHFHYAYGNGWCSYGYSMSAPNMGNAVHIDVE